MKSKLLGSTVGFILFLIVAIGIVHSQGQNFPVGGSSSYPITVSGATSGGIPCFTSSTVQASSSAIAVNDAVVGGGAGACVKDSLVPITQGAVATANSVAVGAGALAAGTVNNTRETAIGVNALNVQAGAIAVNSTAVGNLALSSESGGSGNNTAVGEGALSGVTSGTNNIGIGQSSCPNITTTNNNICVGQGTATSTATDTNTIQIGAGVTGAGSNTAIIGGSAITDEFLGSSTAASILHSANLAMITGSDYTNATAGATNITGLSFALLASKKYVISCKLIYQGSASTTTMTLTSTGPASPTKVTGQTVMDTTSGSGAAFFSGAFDGTTFGFSAGPPSAIVTTATDLYSTLDVGIVNGASAGTWQLQATDGTGTLTIRVGSFCMMQAQ